jgi:hypothetical protein
MLKSPFWDFFDNLTMYHKFPNHFKICDISNVYGIFMETENYRYPQWAH